MNKDEKLEVFNDDYFRGLQPSDVAELAKKSIRLTAENRRLEEALEEIEEFCLTYSDNHDAYETVYKYILDIISGAKGEE